LRETKEKYKTVKNAKKPEYVNTLASGSLIRRFFLLFFTFLLFLSQYTIGSAICIKRMVIYLSEVELYFVRLLPLFNKQVYDDVGQMIL